MSQTRLIDAYSLSFLTGLFSLKANLTFNKRVLDAHRWHINKLERLQRKLNNETRHGLRGPGGP